MIIVESGKETQLTHTQRSKNQLSNAEKLCPRCGKPGSGPYRRWVQNSVGKRYWYWYFAHREGEKMRWCYIGKAKKLLDNAKGATAPLSNTQNLKMVSGAGKAVCFRSLPIGQEAEKSANQFTSQPSYHPATILRRH